MGWKMTVAEYRFSDDDQRWQYHEIYWGNSLGGALWAAYKAKRKGAGCVRLEWR